MQGSKNKQMHDTTSTHLAELRVHVEAVIQAKLEAHEQTANGYESAVFPPQCAALARNTRRMHAATNSRAHVFRRRLHRCIRLDAARVWLCQACGALCCGHGAVPTAVMLCS